MSFLNRRKLLALGAGTVAAATAGTSAQAAPSEVDASRAPSPSRLADSLPGSFTSSYVQTNGVRLHYVAGGSGAPVILLHGWPQTWWEYRKVMPDLATKYRVIAVDLRGGGESSKPQSGYDKKTMAADIAGLITALGYTKAHVVGHDIGAMVAYSLTVNKPQAVDKLVMLDVAHPNSGYYDFRMLPAPGAPFHPWWFAFNQVDILPERLVAGRSRFLVDWMFDYLLVNHAAISSFDRAIFAQAYATSDAIRGGNGWYKAFGQDIIDNGTYGQIATPTLGLACPAFYPGLAATLSTQATNLQLAQIADTGHYFVDEQPAAVVQQLKAFLG
ncbi:alpha/beta hydrolase [Micromonospora peucetia]|uniref:Alpha/beta hydrolase n=1 Tax=Micromonospora peucetia TaxID=47871 RepID=A0ABZ1E9R2_9ACTN|nr:alpha/beta hydrolase [Micromonospora peucetia]MCX4388068.1 alpha/beta hydrolase [Micromonospora peucetia]WSA31244.1 alpha/beta hydrolase [Micromonospora peucetia]